MPTKARAAQFKDFKHGKTLWHVYAVFENDGSIRILSKEPEPYFITGKPFREISAGFGLNKAWRFKYNSPAGIYGRTTGFLNDSNVSGPENPVYNWQFNRLFTSRKAAIRYIKDFPRRTPTAEHMKHLDWLAEVDSILDSDLGYVNY